MAETSTSAPAATVPEIVEFGWSTPLPTAGDPPLPDDPVSFHGTVRDLDGDGVIVTLSLADVAGRCPTDFHCWMLSRDFGPGEAARSNCPGCSVGVTVSRTYDAPRIPLTGILTCGAVDSAGRSAAPLSTCFRMSGAVPCPLP